MKYKVIITNKKNEIIKEEEFGNKIDAARFFNQIEEIENSQEIDNDMALYLESKKEFLTVTSYLLENDRLFPIAVKYCKINN